MQHRRVGEAAETDKREMSDKIMTPDTQQLTEVLSEVLSQCHYSIPLPSSTLSCLVRAGW